MPRKTLAKFIFENLTEASWPGVTIDEDKQLIEYPEMFHALSIDLDREKVFADILNWVERRI